MNGNGGLAEHEVETATECLAGAGEIKMVVVRNVVLEDGCGGKRVGLGDKKAEEQTRAKTAVLSLLRNHSRKERDAGGC